MSAGRLLGIDHGESRLGLAISDPLGLTAQGAGVVEGYDERTRLEGLQELIADKEVAAIVVGLPLSMDGSEGEQARRAREFAARVAERYSLPVTLWDERLSSQQARRILAESGKSRRGKREAEHVVAAQLMLQSYLEASARRRNDEPR